MSCTITLSGVALDCANVGGLTGLYIADVADVTGVTITNGEVASLAMASGKKFKAFKFRKTNANYTTTSTRDDASGTLFYQTVTEAKFNKMETVKRTEMAAIAKGNTLVIAKDANGLYWLIGYSVNGDGYNYRSVNGASGAAMGDANQYTLTLTADTPELPYQINAAWIATNFATIVG